jgi:hypothetical protein
MVTDCFNPEVNSGNINISLPDTWPEGLNIPAISFQISKVFCSIKNAPRHCYNDIHTTLCSQGTTQCLADPNLWVDIDGVVIRLDCNDISMLDTKLVLQAAIEDNVSGVCNPNYQYSIY